MDYDRGLQSTSTMNKDKAQRHEKLDCTTMRENPSKFNIFAIQGGFGRKFPRILETPSYALDCPVTPTKYEVLKKKSNRPYHTVTWK